MRILSTGIAVTLTESLRQTVRPIQGFLAVTAVLLVSACAAPQPGEMVNDPYENVNRKSHAVNKAVDRAVLRPTAMAYGTVVPNPARQGVSNMADNLELPSTIINGLMQADGELVLNNTFRFLINSTVGLAGLLDPASQMGLVDMDTDFGETLHVWGAREGAYVEIPLLGPSTERDAFGKIVDAALNPVRLIVPVEYTDLRYGLSAGEVLDDRYRFDQTISSTLYESADSYAQARLLYLQNRRFELGQSAEDDQDDPYYFDPYEDPYAQ